jgi:hydroxymethylpyrimidine pyrophosphatase-like HAD family hydrolase
MNEELGLPYGPMKTIRVAFDVDGTLRCNCSDTCQDPNERQIEGFKFLAHMKNTEMYIWSGGGADYARRFADKFGLKAKCISKLGAPEMDIAIDDIQDTAIGITNLIVREK